jgi:hypothetical protein
LPRAKLFRPGARDSGVNEAITNLAVHHIAAIRRSRSGEILQVKHTALGWMSVATYTQMQWIDKFLSNPLVAKIIEGGYLLKAAVWNINVDAEVLASGVTIPFGLILVGIAGTLAAVGVITGNWFASIFPWIALALPFGEIWLFYAGAVLIYNGLAALGADTVALGEDIVAALEDLVNAVQAVAKTVQSIFPGGSQAFNLIETIFSGIGGLKLPNKLPWPF